MESLSKLPWWGWIIFILILLLIRYAFCKWVGTQCKNGKLPGGGKGCCSDKCNFFWVNKTKCFNLYGTEISETEYQLDTGD